VREDVTDSGKAHIPDEGHVRRTSRSQVKKHPTVGPVRRYPSNCTRPRVYKTEFPTKEHIPAVGPRPSTSVKIREKKQRNGNKERETKSKSTNRNRGKPKRRQETSQSPFAPKIRLRPNEGPCLLESSREIRADLPHGSVLRDTDRASNRRRRPMVTRYNIGRSEVDQISQWRRECGDRSPSRRTWKGWKSRSPSGPTR